jgi:hypothetical protein
MKHVLPAFMTLFLSLNLNAQTLYFPPTTGNAWETISPQSLGYCQARIDSLYAFLAASNTRAFILLQDGKIVLEQYFQGHTPSTPWPWASAGKTITAFMCGHSPTGRPFVDPRLHCDVSRSWLDELQPRSGRKNKDYSPIVHDFGTG